MTRTGFNDGWTVGPNVSVFAEITGAAETAREVRLPHDAMLELPRDPGASSGSSSGYFEGGAVSYRKVFIAPEEWRSQVVEVEFHGVYRDAMVYLNGVLVGQRPSGYTPFRVRLDEPMRYGQENRLRVDARAHRDSRWYSGLGIHRDVDLLVMPVAHLVPNGVRVSAPDIDDERAVVTVATEVANDGRGVAVRQVLTRILDPDSHVVAVETSVVTMRTGATETVNQRLYVGTPQRWSVDRPALYRAETELLDDDLVTDTASTAFGIRRLQLDPAFGLRINGETVKLKGACIHHDNGVLGAVSVPEAELRRVRILKAAGFNAVRSAHNPASPALLDACDRLGMLVMDETFDMWSEGKQPFDYSMAFTEWWDRDVQALVQRDFNHPSVILYSIGNEILDAGKPLGAQIGRRIAEQVRALDPTRFLTNAISAFVATLSDTVPAIRAELGDTPGGINDVEGVGRKILDRVSRSRSLTDATAESNSVVDVVGHNYAAWRYEDELTRFPNRVVVGTETNPRDIDVNWALVERLPHVIGDFTWTGWDYLGEAGLGLTTYSSDGQGWHGDAFPALLAYCGDIDITGFRRPASFYREIVFGLRAQPYLAVHRPRHPDDVGSGLGWAWTDSTASWTWDVPSESAMTVDVYSDADEVELLLNGETLGIRPCGPTSRFTATFTVPYEPGELRAVALRGGQRGEEELLRTAGPVAAVRASAEPAEGERVFVAIELVDDDGAVVPTADYGIIVRVDGGELAGLGTARPVTLEGFTADHCTTFEGRALAVVRLAGGVDATLSVSADGSPPMLVTLPLRPPRAVVVDE